MNTDKRHIGFWSLQTLNPDFWTFEPIYIQGNPKFNSIPPRSRWHYGEMAAFYIAVNYGEWLGTDLYYPTEPWMKDVIPRPSASLLLADDYCSVVIWLECWEYDCVYESPANPENYKYRLRYNDGDDTYMEKYYATKPEALEDFELLKTVTYQHELKCFLSELNFQIW